MYNGVGLSTSRGSGTSGHVQRNAAVLPRKGKDNRTEHHECSLNKKPNEDLLEHTRKRKVEIKCLELSDTLEEQGYTQEEIDTKVGSYRKTLLDNYNTTKQCNEVSNDLIYNDTHSVATAQVERNDKLKNVFDLVEN